MGGVGKPAWKHQPCTQKQRIEQHAKRHHHHAADEVVFTGCQIDTDACRNDGGGDGSQQTAYQTAPFLNGHRDRRCDDTSEDGRE